MVRAMLTHAKMPRGLWGEALLVATAVINRAPTKANGGISPYQLWTGKRPAMAGYRAFGAHCYVHVPRALRNKLDDSARPARYVGPALTGSHHRVWYPGTRTVTESRSVTFVIDTPASAVEGEVSGTPSTINTPQATPMDDNSDAVTTPDQASTALERPDSPILSHEGGGERN